MGIDRDAAGLAQWHVEALDDVRAAAEHGGGAPAAAPADHERERILGGVGGAAHPLDGVVANADRVVLVVELEDARHRPDDLLLGDVHLVVEVGEDRGLEAEGLGEGGIRGRPAAAAAVRALILADLDVALDLALLLLGDERSHAGREVERVTDLDLLRALDEALDEALRSEERRV